MEKMKERNTQDKITSATEASITVETAILMPVVLFAVFTFLSLYRFMEIDEALRFAAATAAEELSLYGFLSDETYKNNLTQEQTENMKTYDVKPEEEKLKELLQSIPEPDELIGDFTEAAIIGFKIIEALPDNILEGGWVVGGKAGIQFWDSHILKENQVIIKINYSLQFPLFSKILPKFPIVRQVVLRSFTGREKEGIQDPEAGTETETKVYITTNGKVYHIKRDCTYIQLSIKTASAENITEERNANGGKYSPCSKCGAIQKKEGNIYITEYGELYHALISCSSLKRTVQVVTITSAKSDGKRACSKCGKNENEEKTENGT